MDTERRSASCRLAPPRSARSTNFANRASCASRAACVWELRASEARIVDGPNDAGAYVLEMEEPDNAIVFCNTRDDTALVTAVLNRNGFDAELLNGDLPQKERERVMAKVNQV